MIVSGGSYREARATRESQATWSWGTAALAESVFPVARLCSVARFLLSFAGTTVSEKSGRLPSGSLFFSCRGIFFCFLCSLHNLRKLAGRVDVVLHESSLDLALDCAMRVRARDTAKIRIHPCSPSRTADTPQLGTQNLAVAYASYALSATVLEDRVVRGDRIPAHLFHFI
jgi:hypothetical protein